MALEQAREAAELAVPVFLAALRHHGTAFFGSEDLLRPIGRRTEHADGVIVGEHDILDRLIRHTADLLHHLVGEARGGLGIDDHHAVVADDDAGVRIALRGEGPDVAADLAEGDLLFRHVAG